jgi:formamidopyrimidine-DNA glycosylase
LLLLIILDALQASLFFVMILVDSFTIPSIHDSPLLGNTVNTIWLVEDRIMPELPEMETYRTLLSSLIGSKKITNVVIQREKSINIPIDRFTMQVTNQTIKTITRRAKYLIFQLENGSCLLLHLMLGGWMFFGKEENKPERTVQVKLSLGDQHLFFIGLRLGYLHLLSPEKIKEELEKLGPEPLEPHLTIDAFKQLMQNRKGAIKSTLINQEVLAGIGNGYSDEILWHAELRPDKKINDLDNQQLTRLYNSIQTILKKGIKQGGYMENPLYKGDGKTGGYQFYVHAREGEECPRCRVPIVIEEISSRKTYFCQNCQH